MTALLAALFLGGLPVFAPQDLSSGSMSATAQTRRTSRSRTYTDTSVVSVGDRMRIRLNNNLSSKDSRVGDRFTADVIAPERYQGGKVYGRISSIKKSGRVKGRTSMVLAFNAIELRGRRSAMRAEVVNVDVEGSAKADEEGAVESGSRGKQTAKRAGIGAAAGAVLGAIVGGGKGAAIGLIVGGAAGAGSIAIEGSKDLELDEGTEMVIRVTR
jgi:hypothetical protein